MPERDDDHEDDVGHRPGQPHRAEDDRLDEDGDDEERPRDGEPGREHALSSGRRRRRLDRKPEPLGDELGDGPGVDDACWTG